ncbi:type II toxin-antitoxin system PemK/MazF family toxin [Bacteroidota bacterium]
MVSEDDVNKLLNVVNIITITSLKTGRIIYPNEVRLPPGKWRLDKDSIALCHQIRTIDKHRLTKKYGEIFSKSIKEEIIDALHFQSGI